MSSIRCPRCGLTNWVQAINCKRCGAELAAEAFPPSYPETPPPVYEPAAETQFADTGRGAYQTYSTPGRPENPSKTGLAMASMILGIICIPTAIFLIGIAIAPIALVLGIVALAKISKQPHIYGGRGFAIAGIITGAVGLVFFIPLVAAIAIPNLLAAKRSANEASAQSTLRTIFAAEATYMATAGAGACGDLSALAKGGLIDPSLANGLKNDFKFEVASSALERGCEIFATPVSKSGGTRSFMVSQDGVLRAAKKNGARADKQDTPVGN